MLVPSCPTGTSAFADSFRRLNGLIADIQISTLLTHSGHSPFRKTGFTNDIGAGASNHTGPWALFETVSEKPKSHDCRRPRRRSLPG